MAASRSAAGGAKGQAGPGPSPSKRREMDIMKLMMSDFRVHIPDEARCHEFAVVFHGPKDTPYEGGQWRVHVALPHEYPFRSPSIGFANRLFHPNVDETSGSVCLDVINQTWSPMYDLVNVFDVFLPQLLRYPNPSDPLNGEAATLLLRDPDKYQARVREYVQAYASASLRLGSDDDDDDSDSGEEGDGGKKYGRAAAMRRRKKKEQQQGGAGAATAAAAASHHRRLSSSSSASAAMLSSSMGTTPSAASTRHHHYGRPHAHSLSSSTPSADGADMLAALYPSSLSSAGGGSPLLRPLRQASRAPVSSSSARSAAAAYSSPHPSPSKQQGEEEEDRKLPPSPSDLPVPMSQGQGEEEEDHDDDDDDDSDVSELSDIDI